MQRRFKRVYFFDESTLLHGVTNMFLYSIMELAWEAVIIRVSRNNIQRRQAGTKCGGRCNNHSELNPRGCLHTVDKGLVLRVRVKGEVPQAHGTSILYTCTSAR